MGGKNAADRRRRRRPRPGRARQRRLGVRLRRPEVLGRQPAHRGRRRRTTQVVERLVAATRELVVGPARRPETQVGPVIDADAHKRILRHARATRRRQGRVLVQHADVPPTAGTSCRPPWSSSTTRTHRSPATSSSARCSRVLRAADIDEAIALANDTDYALTAGVLLAARRRPSAPPPAELRAGNVYVNRHDHRRGRRTPAVRWLRPVGRRARRPAAPTTCCSSSTRGSSPRTRCGRASRPTCEVRGHHDETARAAR